MIVKNNFYVARHGNDAYMAYFVPAASTLKYLDHNVLVSDHDHSLKRKYSIRCILNEEEVIVLNVLNRQGSKDFILINCDHHYMSDSFAKQIHTCLLWKDFFVEDFFEFLPERSNEHEKCANTF